MSHDAAGMKKQVRIYVVIFAILSLLTFVTIHVSRLHLALPLAVGVALTVATFKGSLVASYFMHLISEKKIIHIIMLITLFFFALLLLLPVLSSLEMARHVP
jgi:cytochrome c oxidase subunit 4